MVYTIRIPKKYFYKIKELCEDYKSYRECIIREIEKKYGVKIYNPSKSHDSRLKDDFVPKPTYIFLYDEENMRLEELAKRLGVSKYEIIMSVLK
jgi:predicted DNA-binding protein